MHNQINDIIRQIFKKNALEDVSEEELSAFITQYPYVSIGHYLRAQKIYDRDPSAVADEQQTAALYIHNPLWLPWLLSKNYAGAVALSSTDKAETYNSAREAYVAGINEEAETTLDETPSGDAAAHSDAETQSDAQAFADAEAFPETEPSSESQTFVETEAFPESEAPSGSQTPAVNETFPDAEPSSESLTFVETEAFPESEAPLGSQTPNDSGVFPETEKSQDIALPPPDKVNEIQPAATNPPPGEEPQATSTEQANPENDENDRPIAFQSYHTIDYFASQGIRLQPVDLTQDKLGRQLKSFTEWLKSMKKLSATAADPAKETSPEEASLRKRVVSIAEHSLEDKEIITEAMAEVWAKQGNAQKAAAIYQKLSLQNPHKNAYFAAKIKQLNVS